MSCLFSSDDQNTGASVSTSVVPVNIQSWSPLWLTGLISLLSKGLSGVFSSTIVWRHQFFGIVLLSGPAFTTVHDHWDNHSLDYMDLVGRVMSLLFSTLSRFALAFLLRRNRLLISWLQSSSAVILEPQKRKSVTTSTFSPYLPWRKCCIQYASKIGKLSSGHRTGKGQFSFQSQRKVMPKNAQTTTQLHSSQMLVK